MVSALDSRLSGLGSSPGCIGCDGTVLCFWASVGCLKCVQFKTGFSSIRSFTSFYSQSANCFTQAYKWVPVNYVYVGGVRGGGGR